MKANPNYCTVLIIVICTIKTTNLKLDIVYLYYLVLKAYWQKLKRTGYTNRLRIGRMASMLMASKTPDLISTGIKKAGRLKRPATTIQMQLS